MAIHRVDLEPAGIPHDQAVMTLTCQDEFLGISHQPLYDAARELLQMGIACEADRIETWRGDTMCLAGPVWAAAKLTVWRSTLEVRLHTPLGDVKIGPGRRRRAPDAGSSQGRGIDRT